MEPAANVRPVVDVSVVVATWNRAARLQRLVDALAKQEGAPPFELVVVDDGSEDDTPDVLAALAATAPFPLRPIRLDGNQGPAVARNAGWRAATGELILFTDDDCWPEPGWVAAMAEALAGADLVQGRTSPDPEVPDRDWLAHTIEVLEERGLYETCNMGYQRSWLERVGGFDERFRSHGGRSGPIYGEDTDLAWRMKEQGARSAFCDDAVVIHEVRPGTLLDRLRSLRRREGIVMLVRRHPEVRSSFGGGWWFQHSHRPALLALAGGALALTGPRNPLRWLVGLWLAYPYIAYRTSGLAIWHRVKFLPQILAVDLGEIAVLAWASAKHRTLVL